MVRRGTMHCSSAAEQGLEPGCERAPPMEVGSGKAEEALVQPDDW